MGQSLFCQFILEHATIKHTCWVRRIAGLNLTSILRFVTRRAESYFHNTFKGQDCQLMTILVTPIDSIGRAVAHYV